MGVEGGLSSLRLASEAQDLIELSSCRFGTLSVETDMVLGKHLISGSSVSSGETLDCAGS